MFKQSFFRQHLLTCLLLFLGQPAGAEDTIQTVNPLDIVRMQSCYEQFTTDHGMIVGDYYRRNIYSKNLSSLTPIANFPVTNLNPATQQTCADIFKALHSSALKAFSTPGTPNLFPSEYYGFLMDKETIQIVRELLQSSEPDVAPRLLPHT